MGLDIRYPIGLMFSIIGLLVAVYGLVTGSNKELYARSLDINIKTLRARLRAYGVDAAGDEEGEEEDL